MLINLIWCFLFHKKSEHPIKRKDKPTLQYCLVCRQFYYRFFKWEGEEILERQKRNHIIL